MKKIVNGLFYVDSHDSIVRVLQSWRLWIVGAIAGALLAAGVYALFPPDYRARAVVVVDHNLEEVWQFQPAQTFYFLGRETRKLEELAWSDETMQMVADQVGGATIRELRDGILLLSQPADGGWYFYADDRDPQRAEALANAWVAAFVQQVYAGLETSAALVEARAEINEILLANPEMSSGDIQKLIDRISPELNKTKGLSPYLEVYISQGEQLPVARSINMGVYILSGSMIGALALGFAALVVLRAEEKDEFVAE